MTEEQARHHAEAVARSMGITFYVVRTREGLDTEVRPGSTVILLPAMAGG